MNTAGVLEYYKELKAIHTDEIAGLDPTFPDWNTFKAAYEKEYYADRFVVTEEEADEIADVLVDVAEIELGLIAEEPILDPIQSSEDNISTEEIHEVIEPSGFEEVVDLQPEQKDNDQKKAKKKAKSKKVVKKAKSKKVVAKKRTVNKSNRREVKKMAKSEKSKVEVARGIYNKMANKPRKDVIEAFMEKANLTKAGASTYYQKFRGE